jgi:hypothetical protein
MKKGRWTFVDVLLHKNLCREKNTYKLPHIETCNEIFDKKIDTKFSSEFFATHSNLMKPC